MAPQRIPLVLANAFIALLICTVASVPLQSQSRGTPPIRSISSSSIVYVNREYGFRFYLPRSWKGYSVTVKRTEDNFAQVEPAFITIRHPLWTRQDPHEDIPIMVFAIEEWPKVKDGRVSVSAAPFAPWELGRNKKYVFALPARYNYDFSTGWEEVDKIMKDKPLQGFD